MPRDPLLGTAVVGTAVVGDAVVAGACPVSTRGAIRNSTVSLSLTLMNDSSSAASAIATALTVDLTGAPAGTRLPSQRELVRRFGASATTVAQALGQLRRDGVVETRPGAGTFTVAPPAATGSTGDTSWQDAALELTDALAGGQRRYDGSRLAVTMTARSAEVVDLNGGYLHPALQPLDLLRAATARAARRPDTWDRPPTTGLPELRDWFAGEIGGGLGRHDVLVCPAGQAALASTLRALAQPGDPVVVETPSYPGTTAAAAAAGLDPLPVPMDEDGLLPTYLDEALTRTRARVVVLQPTFQNPTGTVMPPERREQVRQIARRHQAFVVEDDFARGLVHADAPAPPPPMITDDPDGTVVHIRSLTKMTSPNLRVGAVAARGPVLARLRTALLVDTLFVPALLQHTALELVSAPGWERSRRQLSSRLTERAAVAEAAVRETLGAQALARRPSGGFHLWARLPEHLDPAAVAAEAMAHGVAVTPGLTYATGRGEPLPFVRLSLVAAPSAHDVGAGIRRLAPVVAAGE